MTGESAFVGALTRRFGPAAPGETWIGDDAAVVRPPEDRLLLCIDPMVQGVHFTAPTADVGWTAVARNVSDIAAMGGRPLHALVSLVLPPAASVESLLDGLEQATELCPIVGGDTSSGAILVVTVAVTGTVDGPPVLRTGARPGDRVFVTGPLGGRPSRPRPRVAEGTAARLGGATAMIDVSDGLATDARRLGIGMALDAVPLAEGATWDDALFAGEDYELVFTAPDPDRLLAAFEGLEPPIDLGICTDDGIVRLGEDEMPEGGWEHQW